MSQVPFYFVFYSKIVHHEGERYLSCVMVEEPICVLSLILTMGLEVYLKLFVVDMITSNSELNMFRFCLFGTDGGDKLAESVFFVLI